MTLGDTLSLALRNLRQAKLRSALTTLGVSIGIASLAGMVSLGVGLQDQIIGRLLQSGVFDAVTVTSTSMLGVPAAILSGRGGLRGRGGAAAGSQAPSAKLNDEALKEISTLDNVREVYPNLRVPVEFTLAGFSRLTTAAGVPMSSKGEGAFQTLSYGQFFANESEEACMVSLDLAKQIAEKDPGSLIGKSPTLSYAASHVNEKEPASQAGFQVQRVDRECRIVGIVERDPGGPLPLGGGPPVSVVIPLGIAKTIDADIVTNPQSLLRDPLQPKSYGSVTVKVKQAQFTQDVEDRIRRLGFAVFSVNDALRGAKNAFIVLDIILSLIGSIALAVSSLGIVNTMVMSILERTREIGIMKAIGASDRDIRRIFLIEASTIGLFGGLMGIVIGWTVGRVINFGANVYIRSQGGTPGTLFFLPLWLIASAIAFSIVVSLLAGSYPASRAARLDPIQALRHD
jgi:putative ABC transport system permease protein